MTTLLYPQKYTTTYGVASEQEVIYRRSGEQRLSRVPLASSTPPALELLQLAYAYKLHSLWITPGSTLSRTASNGYIEALAAAGYEYRVSYRPGAIRGGANQVKRASVWKRAGTRAERESVYLVWPEWDLWEWENTEPVATLAGIHYIERALPVSIRKGAALAGRELMDTTNEKHPEWIRQSERELSSIPYSDAGKDIGFKAAGAICYRDGMHVHCYDKNSMYLGAAAGASMGAGTPDYYPPGLLRTPNLKLPGYWRCDFTGIEQSRFDDKTLPSPLHSYGQSRQEWVTTPLLSLCYDIGYGVKVLEGYQWTEYHRTLEEYGNTLWKAREQVKTNTEAYPHAGGRALAYDGIKRIATTGGGLLNSEKSALYDKTWYRPDMWDTLVELAKERIIRQVLAIEQKSGLLPVAIAVDELIYLSPDSNPLTAVAGLPIDEHKLGGYKVERSVSLTPELADAMNNASTSGELKRVVREAYEQSRQSQSEKEEYHA